MRSSTWSQQNRPIPAGHRYRRACSASRHLVPNVTNDADIPVLEPRTIPTDPNCASGNTRSRRCPTIAGDVISSGLVSAPGTTIGEIAVSGPVMGAVNLAGSIDTFYAGWLLTGDANGEPQGVVDDPGNFTVAGDIRNLLVSDSMGTESDSALLKPTYLTGFDMHVGGTIGRVQSFDSIVGNINDTQSPTAQNLTTNIQETEIRTTNVNNPWDLGELGGTTQFNNDTFATAQDVGALPTSVNALPSAAVIDGTLQADTVQQDFVDYYGVALLAGQTITCQVTSCPVTTPAGESTLGVFNPDGDLIATDYNIVDLSQTQQLQFRITTDRPGIYRFAIATEGNATFTDAGNILIAGDVPYQLTIQGTGDLAIGAIIATNNIFDNVDPTRTGSVVWRAGRRPRGHERRQRFLLRHAHRHDRRDRRQPARYRCGLDRPIDRCVFGDPELSISVPNGNVGLVSTTSANWRLWSSTIQTALAVLNGAPTCRLAATIKSSAPPATWTSSSLPMEASA